MIRRTASDVLHDLEMRIAHLEDSISSRTAAPAKLTLRELESDFRNGLAREIEKHSVHPIRDYSKEYGVHGEARPTVMLSNKDNPFKLNVSETDLAAGKLLVPFTIGFRMFFRAPKPVGQIVKVKRGLSGRMMFWGYQLTPDDTRERAEVVTVVQSFCKEFGVEVKNISFPAADKKTGDYPSMYGTLTVMFDLSHYL